MVRQNTSLILSASKGNLEPKHWNIPHKSNYLQPKQQWVGQHSYKYTENPCSAQPPSIPAVPNHQIFLQCSTTKYPCSAQPPSIPAVPNQRVSLQCLTDVPNRKVSLQCPTTKYPCSAQPPSIPAVPNQRVSLQGPTEKYPGSAQAQSIPGAPCSKVSRFLQRICSAARKTAEGALLVQ